MRILIAEDDITSRTVLAGVLKKCGYEVVTTDTGKAAWAALQAPNAPRLAILDWMMPEMDGLEVVRRVRALQCEWPPYIILLTSRDEKSDIIAGLGAGADDYLAKPFDTGELRARVEVGLRVLNMQEALMQSRNALAYQATRDSLTGMLNRRAILEQLNIELARFARHEQGLTVGMCDIDHFKKVNDIHGHQTGDAVLCAVAEIFNESVRDYDSVGRIGGEEFLMIVPTTSEMCPSIYDRVHKKVAESRIATKSCDVFITMSIGVAYAADGITLDTLLEAADAALYRAKREGRNRVAINNVGGFDLNH